MTNRMISEAAAELGVGPRVLRRAMLHMGLMSREQDIQAGKLSPASRLMLRTRITPEVVARGWGLRYRLRGQPPFDVLTPAGFEHVRQNLPAALAVVQPKKRRWVSKKDRVAIARKRLGI